MAFSTTEIFVFSALISAVDPVSSKLFEHRPINGVRWLKVLLFRWQLLLFSRRSTWTSSSSWTFSVKRCLTMESLWFVFSSTSNGQNIRRSVRSRYPRSSYALWPLGTVWSHARSTRCNHHCSYLLVVFRANSSTMSAGRYAQFPRIQNGGTGESRFICLFAAP